MKHIMQFISIKKIVFLIAFFSIFSIKAQSEFEQVFTTVPTVNRKVAFQQFVHADNGLSADQKYALLYKWGKDNYAGNPLLSGIRFDDKARSITVSSKVELLLPKNKQGVREKMVMNYKFDATIGNGGCMFNVRDITFQNVENQGKNFFPKAHSAEEWITDNAVNSISDTQELKSNTRKSTLSFLNELYNQLKAVFELK